VNNLLNRTPSTKLTAVACAALVTALLSGCRPSGPAYWPISGKVTFQGTPVAVGQIRICNAKAGVDIIESLSAGGQFAIVTGSRQGLPEGEYHVAIIPKLDFSNMKCEPNGRPIPSTMPTEAERNPPNIPRKYREPATSGLTLIVKPQPNTFDVDMQ
jgi:hypothetical protein